MNEIIKLIASYFIVIPVIVVGVLFFKLETQRRKQLVIQLIVGGVISLLLAKLGSHFFNDPRPFTVSHVVPLISHSTDNGFPSDHTLLSAFIAFIVLKYSRKYGVALLLIAVFIGAARVLAHVHHVPDIIGSFIFAAIGAALALLLTKQLTKKFHNH